MSKNEHTNITIWQTTVDMLRMAAAMATITTGEKVSQVQFMDEAIREKIERDGLQMPAAK
jgi:hypothetical protein